MGSKSIEEASGTTDDTTTTGNKTTNSIYALFFTSTGNSALSYDVTSTITGTNISSTVPYGTDVTALVATFTHDGASAKVGSVSQTSGTTANDFTSAVTYTITAEDSTTKDYTVTITASSIVDKAITAFSFTSANAALSSTVTVTA